MAAMLASLQTLRECALSLLDATPRLLTKNGFSWGLLDLVKVLIQ